METTYLPDIQNRRPTEPHPTETVVELLYRIIRDSPHQERDKFLMTRHLFLDQAAQQKANDMVEKNYFSHTSPTGISANQNVRMTGYRLPEHYPLDGNNVESLYIGGDDAKETALEVAQEVADAWLNSEHHRAHVYGQNDFFRKQMCIGVGYAPIQKEENRGYFVYISAPCA